LIGIRALVATAFLWSAACAGEIAQKPQARLFDGGVANGTRYAGLEIRLPGAAVTYWRDPGEAGVAPLFDFAGSDNLAEAEPLYPQPGRHDEGGVVAAGYRGAVTFPIRVTPQDATKPVVLTLKLDYAACEKICVPAHEDLSLTLPPTPEAAETAAIEATLHQIPRPLSDEEAGAAADISVLAAEAGKPRWRLHPKALAPRDLFVETASGFFIETRREGGDFILTLAEHPAKRLLPPKPLRLTFSGDAPVEFDLTLPTPSPSPLTLPK
jgi:DsbC/DsbD-like thiol-disulfide interchange protein